VYGHSRLQETSKFLPISRGLGFFDKFNGFFGCLRFKKFTIPKKIKDIEKESELDEFLPAHLFEFYTYKVS
jgi:hypothetical protein